MNVVPWWINPITEEMHVFTSPKKRENRLMAYNPMDRILGRKVRLTEDWQPDRYDKTDWSTLSSINLLLRQQIPLPHIWLILQAPFSQSTSPNTCWCPISQYNYTLALRHSLHVEYESFPHNYNSIKGI